MSLRYEETKAPRFVVETIDGVEQITVPAQRKTGTVLFLWLWLGIWSSGGQFAAGILLTAGFQPFLAFWLCGWVLGEAFALLALAWLFTGSEILRVVGSDLEIGFRILGFTQRKLFCGGEIRNLSSCEAPMTGRARQISLPFLQNYKMGSVKFTYGARTIHAGATLDEAEGRLIVDRLRRRLPSTATA